MVKNWDIWITNKDAFSGDIYRTPWVKAASEIPADTFEDACILFFMGDKDFDRNTNSYQNRELASSNEAHVH